MNKNILVPVISFCIFLLSTVTSYILKNYTLTTKALLITAAIIIAISIIIAIVLRKLVIGKILPMMLNSIALGFAIRAWHIYKEYDLSLIEILLPLIIIMAYLLIIIAISNIPVVKNNDTLFGILITIIFVSTIVAYIIIVNNVKTNWFSTLGYYLIVQIGIIIGYFVVREGDENIIDVMLYSSYTVIIVVIIIAIIIGGADSLDLDVPVNGEGKKKKKNVRK